MRFAEKILPLWAELKNNKKNETLRLGKQIPHPLFI
jgi:hypothetical protein